MVKKCSLCKILHHNFRKITFLIIVILAYIYEKLDTLFIYWPDIFVSSRWCIKIANLCKKNFDSYERICHRFGGAPHKLSEIHKLFKCNFTYDIQEESLKIVLFQSMEMLKSPESEKMLQTILLQKHGRTRQYVSELDWK